MRERGTLRLDAGDVLRVEVDREALDGDEIVIRRAVDDALPPRKDLAEVIDRHLRTGPTRYRVTSAVHTLSYGAGRPAGRWPAFDQARAHGKKGRRWAAPSRA